MDQNWSFEFCGDVENWKRRESNDGKYGLKRTLDVVDCAVYPQLLIMGERNSLHGSDDHLLTRGRRRCNMNDYTLDGCADMHLTYSATSEKGRRAAQLYAEHYRSQRKHQHPMFARVNYQLCETSSFTYIPVMIQEAIDWHWHFKAILESLKEQSFQLTRYSSPDWCFALNIEADTVWGMFASFYSCWRTCAIFWS